MKKIYIILAFATLLILASCSSSQDDMSNMNYSNETKIETPTQKENESSHMMDDWNQMEWETHNKEIDEESIIWGGANHMMDDWSQMEWETHME